MSHAFHVYNHVTKLPAGTEINSAMIEQKFPEITEGAIAGALFRLAESKALEPLAKEGRRIKYKVTAAAKDFPFVDRSGPDLNGVKRAYGPRNHRDLPKMPAAPTEKHMTIEEMRDTLLDIAARLDDPLRNISTLDLQREIMRRLEEAAP